MKRNWMQWIMAFFMGLLMPFAAMRLGQALVSARQEPSAQTQPMATQQATLIPGNHTVPVMLPVLSDGTVQIMELDAYLLGVVLAEMPVDFETEALKAQAVAARTCALHCTREGTKHPGGAVCTDSKCCQAYISEETYLADGGTGGDVEKIRAAVKETAGQILTYRGELIQATYFSCSGGRTEDASAVWGTEVPYLQSVKSPGEEHAAVYSNTVTFSAGEFAAALGRKLSGSCASWLGPVTYTEGGGVATMVVAGKTYTGTELRSLLSLNSTAFSMTAIGNVLSITTSGRGHRVGMSQYGADAMAVAGSTYREILSYYYPGTRIDKLEALG